MNIPHQTVIFGEFIATSIVANGLFWLQIRQLCVSTIPEGESLTLILKRSVYHLNWQQLWFRLIIYFLVSCAQLKTKWDIFVLWNGMLLKMFHPMKLYSHQIPFNKCNEGTLIIRFLWTVVFLLSFQFVFKLIMPIKISIHKSNYIFW